MLAGVETMLRHCDILQGVKFKWFTNHKGLIHLINQKNLSGCQARWLEKISEFDFEIVYVPGVENILSDALSRLYAFDKPGTVRARGEYTYNNVVNNDLLSHHNISMPVLVGREGACASLHGVAVQIGEGPSSDTPCEGAGETVGSAPGRPPRGGRKKLLPAETGCPKTSQEFAARMLKNFVLNGPEDPQGRKEGESSTDTTNSHKTEKLFIWIPTCHNQQAVSEEKICNEQIIQRARELSNLTSPTNAEPVVFTEMLSKGREPIDLLASMRGRYFEDPVFQKVMEQPRKYKNFEVTKD